MELDRHRRLAVELGQFLQTVVQVEPQSRSLGDITFGCQFDPTDFIVANGELYRQAWATAADVLGVSGDSGVNINTATANRATAEATIAADRARRIAALRELETQRTGLTANAAGNYSAADVRKALDAIAKRLETN